MARVNDLQALCRNDEQLTYLQLLRPETDTSPAALARLVRALMTNTHIQRVRVFVPRDFFLRTDEDAGGEGISWLRRRLFEAIGLLPQLEELKIDAYSGLATFPVEILAQTIAVARQLRELELWDLMLALDNVNDENGTNEDLERLMSSLDNHPSLEKFTLYNCQLRENAVCTLDPVLHGLATIPTLKQVYITAAAAASSATTSVSFTSTALEKLCSAPSLQELGLWKFNFLYNDTDAEDPLTLIAPAIAQTNVMTMFEFGKCHLSREGDEALALMLQKNTSLEEIDLHLDQSNNGGNNNGMQQQGCQIVATAKSLEHHNTTLKRLKLWGLLDRRNQEALVRMVQHNYSLETCRLLDADRDVMALIDFYIGLNRNGRKHLLTGSATMTQWLELLVVSDLSTIFYYLSMKPSLCQVRVD